MSHPLLRRLPLLLLIFTLLAAFFFELHEYFTFEALKHHHQFLLMWTKQHPVWAGLIFISLYIVSVAISAPIAIFLNVISGYLFGMFFGTLYAVFAAGTGAVLLFLAVNTALGPWLEQRAQGWVRTMEDAFQRNAFNYLLALRLIPVIPFWVINIVAAILNVRLQTFALATFLGIIPETMLYVWMGNGLEEMFAAGQTPSLSMIFVPSTLIPLIVLAILPLLPLIYNWVKKIK